MYTTNVDCSSEITNPTILSPAMTLIDSVLASKGNLGAVNVGRSNLTPCYRFC